MSVGIVPHLRNLHHLRQLLRVAGNKVQEGQLLKVLSALVRHFHNLVVALHQSSLSERIPHSLLIDNLKNNLMNQMNRKEVKLQTRTSIHYPQQGCADNRSGYPLSGYP